MRLSEAIRLGSMIRPQAFGDYYTDGGSCAIGAAAEASGVRSTDAEICAFENTIEFGVVRGASCPACELPLRHKPNNVVVHLNDDHRWTREQIADWVETIEAERLPADDIATPTNAVAQPITVSNG